MCVFLDADIYPVETVRKKAPGYGLSAQLMRTQPFSKLLLLHSFRIGNISSIKAAVAGTSIRALDLVK